MQNKIGGYGARCIVYTTTQAPVLAGACSREEMAEVAAVLSTLNPCSLNPASTSTTGLPCAEESKRLSITRLETDMASLCARARDSRGKEHGAATAAVTIATVISDLREYKSGLENWLGSRDTAGTTARKKKTGMKGRRSKGQAGGEAGEKCRQGCSCFFRPSHS